MKHTKIALLLFIIFSAFAPSISFAKSISGYNGFLSSIKNKVCIMPLPIPGPKKCSLTQ